MQDIIDWEERIEEYKSNIEDLKYFYKELLDEYLIVLKESGLALDLQKSREIWENKIKIY